MKQKNKNETFAGEKLFEVTYSSRDLHLTLKGSFIREYFNTMLIGQFTYKKGQGND